jgi:hypothetical protein
VAVGSATEEKKATSGQRKRARTCEHVTITVVVHTLTVSGGGSSAAAFFGAIQALLAKPVVSTPGTSCSVQSGWLWMAVTGDGSGQKVTIIAQALHAQTINHSQTIPCGALYQTQH